LGRLPNHPINSNSILNQNAPTMAPIETAREKRSRAQEIAQQLLKERPRNAVMEVTASAKVIEAHVRITGELQNGSK
jgi:hypothetical protein